MFASPSFTTDKSPECPLNALKPATSAILHIRNIKRDSSLTFGRSLHTLRNCIRSKIQIINPPGWFLNVNIPAVLWGDHLHHPRVVIPLPIKWKFLSVEIITSKYSFSIFSRIYLFFHRQRHMSIFISQHRPSVYPTARHKSKCGLFLRGLEK